MQQRFSHIDTWVFDLDNTLYPASMALFDQINEKMAEFVMRELNVDWETADQLRSTFYKTEGTTLAGLMNHHGMAPEPFLEHVHDINLDHLIPDLDLCAQICTLPGRKIIYTNGSRDHALRVSKARSVFSAFDAIYGIEDANFVPKPKAAAFATVFEKAKVTPTTAAFFEDEPRNLEVPKSLGMSTFCINTTPQADYVDVQGETLVEILDHIHTTGLGKSGQSATSQI